MGMNISANSNQPGEWDYYCGGCDQFFSVHADKPLNIKYCPACGWDTLIKSQEEFDRAYPHGKYRRTA
jgi:rRNA maturation endonuclease Nob1